MFVMVAVHIRKRHQCSVAHSLLSEIVAEPTLHVPILLIALLLPQLGEKR